MTFAVVCCVSGSVWVGSANAAAVSVTSNLVPQAPILGADSEPASLELRLDVGPEFEESRAPSVREITIHLPEGLRVNVDESLIPPCAGDELNETLVLSDPASVIEKCSESIVGFGSGSFFLDRFRSALLSDPVLVVFYAGTDENRNTKIKVYGYSKLSNTGILLTAGWNNGVLGFPVPRLPFLAATRSLALSFPGREPDRPELGLGLSGTDQQPENNFLEVGCPAGEWVTKAKFGFGTDGSSRGEGDHTEVSVYEQPHPASCEDLENSNDPSGEEVPSDPAQPERAPDPVRTSTGPRLVANAKVVGRKRFPGRDLVGLRLRIANFGGEKARRVRICASRSRSIRWRSKPTCEPEGSIVAGGIRQRIYRLWSASSLSRTRKGTIPVTFKVGSGNGDWSATTVGVKGISG